MKITKRIWALFLSLILTIAVFTGCSKSEELVGVIYMTGTESSGYAETDDSTESGAYEETGDSAESDVYEETGDSAESGAYKDKGFDKETGVQEDGLYTSKDEVALYIHTYGSLPDNFITKKEAQELGWDSKEGNLWDVAPGKSIGGSRFGNYEQQLPEADRRKYFECDINYEGGYRGAERLIYSNDGLIFYTDDHYNTFEQLY